MTRPLHLPLTEQQMVWQRWQGGGVRGEWGAWDASCICRAPGMFFFLSKLTSSNNHYLQQGYGYDTTTTTPTFDYETMTMSTTALMRVWAIVHACWMPVSHHHHHYLWQQDYDVTTTTTITTSTTTTMSMTTMGVTSHLIFLAKGPKVS